MNARHRCHKHHRSAVAWAKCAYPHAAWIAGPADARYAVLAPCGAGLTITLHRERAAADAALDWIDSYGCGGGCTPRYHRLIALNLNGETPAIE